MTQTKQQEFLEDLKNPTKGRISKAVKHFQQNHGETVREIRITQNIEQCYENEFTIVIIGGNYNLLLKETFNFVDTLEQFMKNAIINRPTWITEEFDGTYRVTYYVTEA